MDNKSAKIDHRRKVAGAVILALATIAAFTILFSWWNLSINRHQKIALYFEESVNGLSAGADVRMNGQKIGQISSIKIRSIPVEHGNRKHYVLVSAAVDMRKFHDCTPRIHKNDFDDIQEHVRKGLSARLLLPSLLSPGLSVEFFIDPSTPRALVIDSKNSSAKIPVYTKKTSAQIDYINNIFAAKNLQDIEKKIRQWELGLNNFSLLVGEIDFVKMNAEYSEKISKLSAAASPEKFHATLAELNKRISKLNESLEKNQNDLEENISSALEQIIFFQRDLDNLNSALHETTEMFSGANILPMRENTEALQKILKKISATSKKILF